MARRRASGPAAACCAKGCPVKSEQAPDPLSGLNLLALRIFSALHEEQSVAKVAGRLFLTPSAVSHALRRMRELLQDDLFVRKAGQMVPTSKATQIAPQIDEILHRLRRVLGAELFDPKTDDHTFAIASLPYSTWAVTTKAIVKVMAETRGIRLRSYSLDNDVVGLLEEGTLDLAVGTFPKVPPTLERKTLLQDRIVWVMRSDHPAAQRPFTVELIGALEHLKVDIAKAVRPGLPPARNFEHLVSLDDYGALQNHLAALGLSQKVRATVPDIPSGLAIVARSDLIMSAPAQIARSFAGLYDLRIHDAPYKPDTVDVHMIWHRDHGRRESSAWLRQIMEEVAGNQEGDRG